jgi:hypothetical protein
VKTESKTPVPSAEAKIVNLSWIKASEDFKVRGGKLSATHVTELRQAINRGSKLPPVTVWLNGKGQLILLDGRHRIAALKAEKPKLTQIEAEIITGSKADALLAAASRNTKAALPLTRREATNVAWKVVRMDKEPYAISKAMIARSCGVSARTVATMRAKWKAWPHHREPSGDWWRDALPDQGADWPEVEGEEALKQRQENTQKLATAFRKAAGMTLEKDFDLFCDAFELMMGHRIAYFLDRLRPPEDDLPSTGLEGDFDGVKVDF